MHRPDTCLILAPYGRYVLQFFGSIVYSVVSAADEEPLGESSNTREAPLTDPRTGEAIEIDLADSVCVHRSSKL